MCHAEDSHIISYKKESEDRSCAQCIVRLYIEENIFLSLLCHVLLLLESSYKFIVTELTTTIL